MLIPQGVTCIVTSSKLYIFFIIYFVLIFRLDEERFELINVSITFVKFIKYSVTKT